MKHLIKKAKTIFADYNKLYTLDACIGHCMDEDDAKQLMKLPRYEISARLMYEYNCTAKSGYTLETANELKYFLPRLLELVVEGAEIHHSEELYLQRCYMMPKDAWTQDELDFLNEFAQAYFRNQVSQNIKGCSCGTCTKWTTIDETLIMLSYLPIDYNALLALWTNLNTPNAILHFALMFDMNSFRFMHNAFASETGINLAITRYFSDAEIQKIWIQKIENLVWKETHSITDEELLYLDTLHTKLTFFE